MHRLSIAHITNTFRADGTGITNVAADLALTQADRGHRVVVVCATTDETMQRLARARGIRIIDGAEGGTPRGLARTAIRLGPLLAAADVLHVHTVRAELIAASAAPVRFIRRSVATVHNPYSRSAVAMLAARRVVALSTSDAEALRARSQSLRTPRVIRNGVLESPRLPPTEVVEAADLPPDSVVFVGALTQRKGLDVLLRSMTRIVAAVPSAHLFVVGNRHNPELEDLATELGVASNVTFAGFSSDPRRFLKSASVFVLPSRAEGFPLALLEARGCGVPVIATNAGGIPEALDGGSAGLLVDAGDDEQLADAVIDILRDPALRARLQAASAAGADQFRVRRMTDDYLRLYTDELLRDAAPA